MAMSSLQAATPGAVKSHLKPQTGKSRTRSRPWKWALSVLCVLVVAISSLIAYRARHVHVDLFSSAVGIAPNGARVLLPAQSTNAAFYPNSRVLRVPADGLASDRVNAERRAAEQAAWLASGTVPGQNSKYDDMVQTALLDLNTLTLPKEGVTVAGWSAKWRYVWPRDAAFTAAAFAETKHYGEALSTLEFLQEMQATDGIFEARYKPDGSGTPDERGVQLDGTGWALWGAARVIATLPAAEQPDALRRLELLITRSTEASLRLTASNTALPPVSSDYWETRETRLTIGTAAPILAGLEAGAQLATMNREPELASALTTRAQKTALAISDKFGKAGYPRSLGDSGSDAAITFLAPPFAGPVADDITVSIKNAQSSMLRPAGGLAPGATWKSDGISWTPETALFAWSAAATGDSATASKWLDWLDAHRTPAGSLPEKVLSNGDPAAVAPLAWTAAAVILAVSELCESEPTSC